MEIRKQHIKIVIPCSVLLFLSFSSLGLSDENRNVAVDQAIGGMDQGRRISSQGSASSKNMTPGNHGYFYSNAGRVNSTIPSQTSRSVNGGTQTGGNSTGQAGGVINANAGGNTTEKTSGSGTTTQEPSGASGSNPVVGVVEVGNATDVTGQELAHEADITTQPVADTIGQTIPEQPGASIETGETHTGNNSPATTTQEPSGTSGNPIVGIEAGIDQNSGTPNIGVSVDATGELEDRQILQIDLAAEGISSSGTQVESVTDTTGSSVVHGADITAESVTSATGSQAVSGLDVTTQSVESIIPAPSDLSAEVDTTGQTVGGTADVGEEAVISGTSDDEDDAKKDPADGVGIL